MQPVCAIGEFPGHTGGPDTVDPAFEHGGLTRPPRRVDEDQCVAPLQIGSVLAEVVGDARLDTMLQRFARDRVGFLMSFRGRDLERALMALRYSGDIFLVVQLAFDLGMSLVPDLYETRRPQGFPMKAGEALFFSSNNLHGSFGNSSNDDRYAMVIRYTSAEVGIFEDQPTIPYNTGSGNIDISTASFDHGIPVHTAEGPVVTTPAA